MLHNCVAINTAGRMVACNVLQSFAVLIIEYFTFSNVFYYSFVFILDFLRNFAIDSCFSSILVAIQPAVYS